MEKTTASIRVDLSRDAGRDRSYDIFIRGGILSDLGEGRIPIPEARSYFIVTDTNVARLYGRGLLRGLSGVCEGKQVELLSFRAGEGQKNVQTAWKLASELSRRGADRGSMVLALGGGVVGDIAGFVASIYKRGIDYVQLPTTLLAQVDSSIGGKTGVDAPWGKNQLGTFHQPRGVMVDPTVLKTLPRGEMVNGMAEIVKCGIIADERMFERADSLGGFDSGIPDELIAGACRVKAEVVSKDEREENLRSILNYGHTVGHAIESASDYRLSHGLSVILGMEAEGWIAARMGIMRGADLERQSRLLRRLWDGSGVRWARSLLKDKKRLLKFALADKKNSGSSLRMSLPERIGRMHVTKEGSYRIPVAEEAFLGSIDRLLQKGSVTYERP